MHQHRRLYCQLVVITQVGLAGLFGFACAPAAHADVAVVAVATNFRDVAGVLGADFERRSGHSVKFSAGSTGKLYAQIRNGAPFDAFLAADRARPERLERDGDGVPGTRFTYATGVLTLWSADARLLRESTAAALLQSNIRHVAIASPPLAPYGAAAKQALTALDLWDAVNSKLVMGQNVGETFAMVASGNAEAGFVALSGVLSPRNRQGGSRWDVPRELYEPIRQDAILLRHGADNPAASQFLDYLRTPEAGAVMRASGYHAD
jgi:molybdate transport system substrate-binding protein